MTKRTYDPKPAVKRGVSYLEKREPGWCERIQLETLRLSSGRFCVLGQLCGSYDDGLNAFALSDDTAVRLGFMLPQVAYYWEDESVDRDAWRELTEAWKDEIEECRRTALLARRGEGGEDQR